MMDDDGTRTTAKLEFSAETMLRAARTKLGDALKRLGSEPESNLNDERVTEAGSLATEAGELLASLYSLRLAERAIQGQRD